MGFHSADVGRIELSNLQNAEVGRKRLWQVFATVSQPLPLALVISKYE